MKIINFLRVLIKIKAIQSAINESYEDSVKKYELVKRYRDAMFEAEKTYSYLEEKYNDLDDKVEKIFRRINRLDGINQGACNNNDYLYEQYGETYRGYLYTINERLNRLDKAHQKEKDQEEFERLKHKLRAGHMKGE